MRLSLGFYVCCSSSCNSGLRAPGTWFTTQELQHSRVSSLIFAENLPIHLPEIVEQRAQLLPRL